MFYGTVQVHRNVSTEQPYWSRAKSRPNTRVPILSMKEEKNVGPFWPVNFGGPKSSKYTT